MKSLSKIGMVVALIVSATVSKAGITDSPIEVNMIGEKTFSLTLNSKYEEDIQVLLKNKRGAVLAERSIANGASTVNFDLNEVKEGNYLLELIDSKEMILFPVEVAETEVKVKENEREAYLFPVIYQKGDLVTISKWATEKENINVLILDSEKELVHVDKLSGDKTLAKRFDFSLVKSGEYQIQLSCKDQTVNKSVDIK